MRFLSALKFLTVIPAPGGDLGPEELGRSSGYFPVVGIIIGLILAGVNWLLGMVLPTTLVNVLLIVSLVVLTGALHLDGFIDSCDGIAGHKTAQERWQVMHDSRVGAFGIVGAISLLLVKYISLSSVPGYLLMAALILMPVVGRWAMVYAVFAYPYARPSGLGKGFKQGVGWLPVIQATVVAGVVAVVLFRVAGLVIMLGIWTVTALVAIYLKRKFAGLTGDSYGAINEVAEVCCLIFILLMADNQWLGLT